MCGDQLAKGLRQGGFGLRDIGASNLANSEAVLSGLELFAQNRDIVLVHLKQGLVAHDVEIRLGYGLEYCGLNGQRLRPCRFDEVDRLAGLRHCTPAAVDRLCRRDGEGVWSGFSMNAIGQTDSASGLIRRGRIARLAGKIDRRPPIRQRLRHALVSCS